MNQPSASSFRVISPETLLKKEFDTAGCDTLASDSNNDEVTTQLLERARQHYLNALNAEELGNSTQSATEFEYSIAILNELGYYPNIENNQDFNDLSHSVIEDYEKYIANIDSLGPQTSIFALRNKLNAIDEATDNPEQDTPKKVITTTTVPLVINGHVEKNIKFFQERGHEHFERWLYLSGKYFPIMGNVFRAEGIPEELKYLSMIESGLNPAARSWARAVGLWQFVKGTGRMYGLTGNFWYDERRDFEKATRAAARHLKDLYGEFGDWYLVLAAYNSGAGRVYHAIRRSGSTDFWRMRPFLPRETRNYVPQFIAAAVMTMDPKTYGFDVTPADSISFDYVTINECVDLSLLAKCARTDVDTLRALNPELIQWCTPPSFHGYKLRIPAGRAALFADSYSVIPDDQKRDWLVHKVRKRETLASIAKRYGITTTLLADANHLSSHTISVGKSLVIPVPATAGNYVATVANEPTPRKGNHRRSAKLAAYALKGKEKLTYRIRKGDSLGKIADWYDVRISDLRLWNEIPYGSRIRVGEILTVWVPDSQYDKYAGIDSRSDADHAKLLVTNNSDEGSETKPQHSSSYWVKHMVKEGESLGKIAKQYGIGVEDLQKWNALNSTTVMKGQTLEVLIEESGTGPTRSTAAAQNDSVKAKKAITYTVKRGDTLHSIASTFGIPVTKLRTWNKIRGTKIHIGQELVINS
ncbi:MAG: LysM peptidoglycan-binding domain-containing protein [Ignavibacteria bacterium]|nr:LysM peptidoglycan-binding domain-containing protein [Ignavibacteria bacterium]MBI3765314.1 LysM peptidoglycan-binding domain-containing protein [Ignavibacteriales bacterium]